MVKRGLSASNGFWNTSCAWRRKSRSRSPASPASRRAVEGDRARRSARPASASGGPRWSCRSPNSPTMATASPSPTSKVTPSSACTAGCAPRTISPSERVTGKCFTTSRSSTSAAMSGIQCGCSEGVGLAVAQAGRAWWVAVAVRSRRSTLQAGWAKGQRGAKRQPEGGSLQVGRAAADRHQLQRVRQQVGEGVAQAHRVGMARPRQHLAHRAALDHLAGIHHHDLVAEIGHDADVVRDQHHREPEPLLQRRAARRGSGAGR